MATHAWVSMAERHHERSLVGDHWLLPAALAQDGFRFSVPQEAALPQPQTHRTALLRCCSSHKDLGMMR